MSTSRRVLIVLALVAVAQAWAPSARAQQASCGRPIRTYPADGWLNASGVDVTLDQCYIRNFSIGGQANRIVIYYTLTSTVASNNIPNIDANGDGINDWALLAGQWTEDAWRTFVGYGFNSPHRTTSGGVREIEARIFDITPGGWCCWAEGIALNAPDYRLGNERRAEEVIIHEAFHSSEYTFEASGGWVNEGTAVTAMDFTDAAIDTLSMSMNGNANSFLGNTAIDLTTRSYNAAPWWKYFMEQLGSSMAEPGRGVDALVDFWNAWAVSSLSTLEDLIPDLSGNTQTLRSLWCDFGVANYVKNMPGAGVPAKYKYPDETQAPGAYDFDGNPATPPVKPTLDIALTPTTPGPTAVTDIRPWAHQYYRLRPRADVPILNLEFRQDTDHTLCYSLLLIRGGDLVNEFRYTGRDFSRVVFNDVYDEVVLVIASYQDYANFRYSINATLPTLRILDPLTARPANVGTRTAPDKLLVKLEVVSPLGGATPVQGINSADFVVRVGSATATQVLPAAYIQGQYWLLVQPPTQAADGLYNLSVELAALADTENNSVRYSTSPAMDNILVIDRSGSMVPPPPGYNKLDAAKLAASLYVDSWKTGDKIGVVSFSDDAAVNMTLRDWTTVSRVTAIAAIDALSAGGGTSIGDGAISGLNELVARGRATAGWALVVLSDGMENRAQFISDFIATYNTRKDAGLHIPQVHTIALGADADRGKLQDLAAKTGGTYHYAADPEPTLFSSDEGLELLGTTTDLVSDLAEYYRVIGETTAGQQQIYSARGEWAAGSLARHVIRVEGQASEAVFIVNNNNGGYSGPGPITLRRPNGTTVSAFVSDPDHVVYRVPSPPSGNWELTVEGCSPGTEFCFGTYLVEASIKSPLKVELYFATPIVDRYEGVQVPMIVSVADIGPIANATIDARVLVPEGITRTMRFYDDGNHQDGGARDGFYGNVFRLANRPGSYRVIVDISGNSAVHGSFRRRLLGSFHLAADADSDGDGMPNRWEADNGLNPAVNDAQADPDFDLLRNISEYQIGTNPQDSDTDNGGENDGSEAQFGRNPLEGADDAIAPILSCSVPFLSTHDVSDPNNNAYQNAATIHFDPQPGHWRYRLYRSSQSTGPWQLLNGNVPPTGEYIDRQVTLNTTYYYLLEARTPEILAPGARSAFCGPVKATAKADPIPPEGRVTINNDAAKTSVRSVALKLEASSDTRDMRIANNSALGNVAWRQFTQSLPWQLGMPGPGELASVFVQFRDAAGNVSLVVSDSIRISQPTGDCDGDNRVDLHDVVGFQNCYTGANGGPIPPGCACVDLDRDDDVDQNDWRLFVPTITGP